MISAILLCGGNSTRFSNSQNKLLCKIDGVPVARRAFDVFDKMEIVEKIVIVRKEGDGEIEKLFENNSKVTFAPAGESRFMSVLSGLHACPKDTSIVAIHDGARPFVTEEVILDSINSAKKFGSGVLAIKVVDTLRKVKDNDLLEIVDRNEVVRVQTPQTFNFNEIFEAYEKASQTDNSIFTDDSLVYSRFIKPCKFVWGNNENEKITYRKDVAKESTSGIGYDIHRLEFNRELFLLGVKIPNDKGLLGHSDADAPIHALMDSLLSAMGKADIGHYFPDTDPQYCGIDSKILLAKVMELVRGESKRVVNTSIAIIAESPKLSPYLDEMKCVIADILGITTEKVGISVTTNEKTGLIGNGEAIAAYAVTTLIDC
ncbi:MAG: 2-C-methyl-D-erythritol 2,4-cyclodiphosphate synthase [Clostridia bacterium]